MSRFVSHDIPSNIYRIMNHSLKEWLEDRVNRAMFAAISFISVTNTVLKIDGVDSDSIEKLINIATEDDTVYIIRIRRYVAALFLTEGGALLVRFSPSSSEACYNILDIKSKDEMRTNLILDSMVNKGTIEEYYHVEAEEFSIICEAITALSKKKQLLEYQSESSNEKRNEYDNSDEDDEDLYIDDSYSCYVDDHLAEDNNHAPYMLGDDDIMYDPESWSETHSNPWGTEDCGDGYVDADGVYYEY